MKKATRLLTTTGALLTAGTLMISPVSAVAAPTTSVATQGAKVTLSAADQQYLNQHFDKLGVDESARPALKAKIARGEWPDSDKGATPVRTTTTVAKGTTTTVTRSVYADGSVSISTVEGPSTEATIQGGDIGHCSGQNQDGAERWRDNCQVTYTALTWNGSYYLRQLAYGSYGYATSPYALVSGGVGVSDKAVNIINAGGGAGKSAWVRMSMHQGVGSAQRDIGFDLKLKTGYALTSYNG